MAAYCSECVCGAGVCVCVCVCVHVDGLNAEHKFQVIGRMSSHTHTLI